MTSCGDPIVSPDGTYRAVAARQLSGRVIGPFKYFGTRNDDPNDIVPHEDRRELRALKVFGAWTNLTDMKAGNTLDTVVTENGRGVVRHYLQDVGSTFGTGALDVLGWADGWNYFYDGGRAGEASRLTWVLSGALADGVVYRSIPRSAASKATHSIRSRGSRMHRRPHSSAPGATTRSGQRGESARSATISFAPSSRPASSAIQPQPTISRPY